MVGARETVDRGKMVDAQRPHGRERKGGQDGDREEKKELTGRRVESWEEIEITGFRRNAGLVRRDQIAEIRDADRVLHAKINRIFRDKCLPTCFQTISSATRSYYRARKLLSILSPPLAHFRAAGIYLQQSTGHTPARLHVVTVVLAAARALLSRRSEN